MNKCPHIRTRIVTTFDPKQNGPTDPRMICDGCGARVADAYIERDERGGYRIVAQKEQVPA